MTRSDLDTPELTEHRRALLARRPFLRGVYEEWYRRIVETLPPGSRRILEIGTGPGFLEATVPALITSDVLEISDVTLIMRAQALALKDSSLDAIVLVNVLHHVPEPRRFFREATRCVRPQGRLIMVEPWLTPWSRLVYRYLHHEPMEPDATAWEFPATGPLSSANIALPWIIFERDRKQFAEEWPQWEIQSIVPTMPWLYLASGGFTAPALMPGASLALWRRAERLVGRWHRRLGMFAYIVLQRRSTDEGA